MAKKGRCIISFSNEKRERSNEREIYKFSSDIFRGQKKTGTREISCEMDFESKKRTRPCLNNE